MNRDPPIAGGDRAATIWLIVFAVISALCYVLIGSLSSAFRADGPADQAVPCHERPLLRVLAIFAVAFACYFGSIWSAVRIRPSRNLVAILWIGAALFRLIMLPSVPIQEIDIYRYIWDGEVTTLGISPYRYPPKEALDAVLRAEQGVRPADQQLDMLVRHIEDEPQLQVVLETIHFGELPTVYPVVSQAVFAAVASVTPADASTRMRCIIMKTAVVLFDLATFATVLYLLQLVGKPIGWAVVYGWCPLVVKEFANSGHLDSIAVFLTMFAIVIAVRMVVYSSHHAEFTRRGGRDEAEPGEQQPFRSGPATCGAGFLTRRMKATLCSRGSLPRNVAGDSDPEDPIPRARIFRATASRTPWLSILALALVGSAAIGAKLYPVVLVPLMGALIVRRFGWLPAIAAGLIASVLVVGMLWPMVGPELAGDHGTAAGLRAFLSRWEMNDFLFMSILENLRPNEHLRPDSRPWFAIVPDNVSRPIVSAAARLADIDEKAAPFFVARTLTGFAFLVIALSLVWNLDRKSGRKSDRKNVPGPSSAASAEQWLRAAFLTIAWFLLLAPTLNPWYWCWALPLAAFARNRTWLVMSALVMAYYLRFWLQSHFADQPVLGTPYHGGAFFHFVVVWFEYFPWFVALAIESWWQRK